MSTNTQAKVVMAASVIVIVGLILTAPEFLRVQGRDDEVILFKAIFGVLLLGVLCTFTWWLGIGDYISEIRHRRWKRRREFYRQSGVEGFVTAVTDLEDLIRAFDGGSLQDKCRKLDRINMRAEQVRKVCGVVCGEEVSGEARGSHLRVTVTKPETRRAFKMLPKDLRKKVWVVYSPTE